MELYQIERIVNKHFNLNIKERTRKREFAEARFFYYYLSRMYTRKSLLEIGRFVGFHHASVVHGVNVIKNLTTYDKGIVFKLRSLEMKIREVRKKTHNFGKIAVPVFMHPYRLRNASQSLREIFNKRRQATKRRDELH